MQWRYHGLLLTAWLLSGCSPESPLANGLTEAHKATIIESTIAQIELSDTFTPENFEQRERKHFETMTPEMLEPALEHLPTRVEEVTSLQVYREAVIDGPSAELEIKRSMEDEVHVSVRVPGSNRYRSEGNPSKTQQVEWTLPWKITVEEGEIVMRHQGIRLKVL